MGDPPPWRMAFGLAKRAPVWQRGVGQTTVSGKKGLFVMIFGFTNLRIGVSGAKFDAEVDFEVHVTPAPSKISKNCEKLMFRPTFFF